MTVLRDVEVDGRIVSVTISGDRIVAVEPSAARASVGALLPGLHDHHLHLLAMAARAGSVSLDGLSAAEADAAIAAPGAGWLRVVDVDEASVGVVDRARLDALAPDRPVRAQDRSGACWTLSSAALRAVGLDPSTVDDGRLWRQDAWLAARVPAPALDLAGVGRRLAGRGVTAVTDATPYEDVGAWSVLSAADLPFAVTVTGGLALAGARVPAGLRVGPVKLVMGDHELPSYGELVDGIRSAHGAGRAVAVHCVTRAAAALLVAAWGVAGSVPGDRVEHGSVLDAALIAALADLGVMVVTQPAFVHAHGDRYLASVDADDLPHLYPCRRLLDAGVPVLGSTDAPFGPDDPWLAIATAVSRRTHGGAVLGAGERVVAAAALRLFTGDRRVEVGAPADLCLLDRPVAEALAAPAETSVVWTSAPGVAGARDAEPWA